MTKFSRYLNFLKMKLKVLGIKRFIFLLLSLTALTEDVHTRMVAEKCMKTEDCREGYICNEGVCHSCFDCALLFREGPSCSIDFEQCGRCLKGYKDFPVTDFSTVIKPCEQIKSKAHSQECLNDDHCPYNNYCHEKSCVKCFDCSLYNRLSPTHSCAKEPQDCSSCLNGFYEVPVTTETNSKPCQKITSDSTQNVSLTQFFESNSNVLLILLGVFEILVIGAIVIYRRHPGGSKEGNNVQYRSPRPPPYSSDICQYVREPEPEVEEESSFFTFVQEEKEQPNTAKVFKFPDAPYYNNSQEEIESLFETDEGEDVNSNVVDPGIQRQSNVSLISNNTERNFVAPYAEEIDDFEFVTEPEVNMVAASDVNTTDPNSTKERTLEESKNCSGGEGLEQKKEKDLTE